MQSDLYKFKQEVDRLADQVGADTARNILRVGIAFHDGEALDVSGAPVTTNPPDQDSATALNESVPADGSATETLDAEGAQELVGRVVRKKQAYNLKVRWQDESGNTLFTDSLASGVTGQTDLTGGNAVEAVAPRAEVVVEDAASTAQTATYSFHLR